MFNIDDLQKLRLQSLFGSMGPSPTFPDSGPDTSLPPIYPSVSPSQPDIGPGNMSDIASRMSQLYHPQTTNIDKFNKMLDVYPTPPNPSGLQKGLGAIGGALTALHTSFDRTGRLSPQTENPGAGVGLYDEITGKNKYKENVASWENQIKPVEQAANIERQANSNERMAAHQTIADQLRQESIDAANKKNDAEARIKQQRADIYQFKAQNPTMKFIVPKGGNVIAVNPVTGQQHDTGIDSGTLTEVDKMNLMQDNKIAQIDETGGQNRQTAETRGWKIYNVPDGKGGLKGIQINEITGETKDLPITGPASNTSVKPPTATVPFNDKGRAQGPIGQMFKKMASGMYNKPPTSTSTTTTNTPSNNDGAPPAPKGWKYVRSADGKSWTAVKDNGGQ